MFDPNDDETRNFILLVSVAVLGLGLFAKLMTLI
jgi:hypothetical protein